MITQPREVQELQKRICSWAIGGALVLAALFLIMGQKPVAKGLVLGTCFSIINFVLLGKSIPMLLGQSRRKASVIGLGCVLARYGILAIPIVIGLKLASFDFVAAIIGVFAVQVMILLDHFVMKPIQKGYK
ncbi:MAG: hypothetical protein JW836_17035 [Deltaproteobacteria bacterium]|nr:hypothetical protein [Deltaproteobacteria bacterium]